MFGFFLVGGGGLIVFLVLQEVTQWIRPKLTGSKSFRLIIVDDF